jgi:hypothetical protein
LLEFRVLFLGRALSGLAFATRFFSYCITKKSSNNDSILHAISGKTETFSIFAETNNTSTTT